MERNGTEKNRMQSFENGVWLSMQRVKIMAVTPWTPTVPPQVEVGCFSVHARDMNG